jgi:hypothetical protein
MVVNNDHFINRILHDAGEYELTEKEFGSRHVAVVAPGLVDPGDPDDVAAVAALQDRFGLEAGASDPFVPGSWDTTSLDATRKPPARAARCRGDRRRGAPRAAGGAV